MRRAVFLACLSLAACRTTLEARWADPWELQPPAEGPFSKAPAVSLAHDERFLLYADPTGASYTQKLEHEVIFVRSEAGKAYADVRIQVPPTAKLVELRGRVREPDGALIEIPRNRVLEQSSESEKQGVGAQVFRFPDVRVGSTLEYSFVLEWPNLPDRLLLRPVGPLPTLKYTAAIKFNRPILYQAKVHNSPLPIDVKEDDSFFQTVQWSGVNLPASKVEKYAPHWSMTEPWWVFRVTRVTFGRSSFDELSSWRSAMARWGRRVYTDPALYEGFTSHLPGGCQTKACTIDQALAFVRDSTDWDGNGEFDQMRPLRQVVEGGRATTFEKAVLLRKLLSDAGVTANLAGAVRAFSALLDLDSPTSWQWNHLLVYLPPQDGLPQGVPGAPGEPGGGLWLDPACEWCRAGELPAQTRGIQALAFYQNTPKSLETELLTTHGAAPIANGYRETYEAAVSAAGDVVVKATDIEDGDNAQNRGRAIRAFTSEQREKDAQEFVEHRSPAGRLTHFTADGCDKVKAICQENLEFSLPGFATVDGDRLLVPLSILSRAWRDTFKPKRTADIALTAPVRNEETVHLHVPIGYVLKDPPPAWKKGAGEIAAAFDVTPEADGATVHRFLKAPLGRWTGAEAKDFAATVNAFAETRDQVLVFVRR